MKYKEKIVETGIPCFACKKKSGMDCPGRKPNEATRCYGCTKIFLANEQQKQRQHLLDLLKLSSGAERITILEAIGDLEPD